MLPVNVISYIVFFMSIAILASPAFAGNDDPISVDARSVRINERNHTVIYSGRVRLIQGDLRIDADKMIAYTRNGKVETVTASGKPIYILRKKLKDSPAIQITANSFKYKVQDKQLTLSGEIKIKQEKDTFTSSTIFYDINKDHLIAEAASPGQQVQAIIYPKKEKNTRDE